MFLINEEKGDMYLSDVVISGIIGEVLYNYLSSNIVTEGIDIEMPSEYEYNYAKNHLYDDDIDLSTYEFYKGIIDRYEEGDKISDDIELLSFRQGMDGKSRNSEFICPNGKLFKFHYHNSVSELGYSISDLLSKGFIRIIGGYHSNYVYIELSKYPNKVQERLLYSYLSSCYGEVYIDITSNRDVDKCFSFDRRTFSVEMILDKVYEYFNG